MARCPKCGNENKRNGNFCGKCGYEFKSNKKSNQTAANSDQGSNRNTIIIIATAVIIIAIILGTYAMISSNSMEAQDQKPADNAEDSVDVNNDGKSSNSEQKAQSQSKSFTVDGVSFTLPPGFDMTSSNSLLNEYNSKVGYYDYYYAYFSGDGKNVYIDVAHFSDNSPYTESDLNSVYGSSGTPTTINGESGYLIPNGKYGYCFMYAQNGKVIGISCDDLDIIKSIV